MTTYDVSKLTDAKILADKPITQGQGRALRDNLLAVIEGDASAPQIQLGAIAFGSDVDGAFSNASSAPTLPGFYDYSSFVRSTPVTFPNYSIIRVQGNFTLSALMTISPVLAADVDGLHSLGATSGNNGIAGATPGGGGGVGAGGRGSVSFDGGTGIDLSVLKRFWCSKRGFIGGLGGISVDGVSKGGGALLLIVTGDVDLSGGTIDASAAAAVANSGYAGGGGGGSIIIVTRGLLRAGTLNAKGAAAAGVGSSNTGGGGGGLIQTAASSYPIAQTTDVTGGGHISSGVSGSAGAVVQETLTAARILGLLYR